MAAQAGIHPAAPCSRKENLDSGLRRNNAKEESPSRRRIHALGFILLSETFVSFVMR